MNLEYSAYHSILAGAFKRAQADYLSVYTHFNGLDCIAEAIDEVEETKVILILALASYIEALVNVYLSLRLNSEQFNFLENGSVLDKWVTAPSLFLPLYEFPKDQKLYEDLKSLLKRRNGLVHSKPEVSRNEKKIHPGNDPKSELEHDKVMRWIALPQQLLSQLKKYDEQQDIQSFLMMCELEIHKAPRRAKQKHSGAKK